MKRVKRGGNKKKKYTEGWVEFLNKKLARRVADSLNGTRIGGILVQGVDCIESALAAQSHPLLSLGLEGGSKRNYYHDDLWSVKYLPKFKWTHLTERLAYDNAVRDQRLQAEVAQVSGRRLSILRIAA